MIRCRSASTRWTAMMKKNILLLGAPLLSLAIASYAQDRNRGQRGEEHRDTSRVGGGFIPPHGPPAAAQLAPQGRESQRPAEHQHVPEQRPPEHAEHHNFRDFEGHP